MRCLLAKIKELTFLNWLTVLAFAMSLVTWIRELLKNRKRVICKPVAYKFIKGHGAETPLHLLYVMIENKSKTPISITSASIVDKDYVLTCHPARNWYLCQRLTGNDTTIVYTLDIPVNLQGLCAAGGVLLFEDAQLLLQIDSKQLRLRLNTTRGTVSGRISLKDLKDLDAMSLH